MQKYNFILLIRILFQSDKQIKKFFPQNIFISFLSFIINPLLKWLLWINEYRIKLMLIKCRIVINLKIRNSEL